MSRNRYVISPYFIYPTEALFIPTGLLEQLKCGEDTGLARVRKKGSQATALCAFHLHKIQPYCLPPQPPAQAFSKMPADLVRGVTETGTATTPAGSSLTTATAHPPLVAEGVSPSKPAPAMPGKG